MARREQLTKQRWVKLVMAIGARNDGQQWDMAQENRETVGNTMAQEKRETVGSTARYAASRVLAAVAKSLLVHKRCKNLRVEKCQVERKVPVVVGWRVGRRVGVWCVSELANACRMGMRVRV
jgi:hypothetical protein